MRVMLAVGAILSLACVSAGEALPADILRRWQQKFHVDILDGIGSTEILHIFISNRAGEIRPGSTGKLVPGYEALIADESGHAVKQGDIGNLLIRGDSTTGSGYARMFPLTQRYWSDC